MLGTLTVSEHEAYSSSLVMKTQSNFALAHAPGRRLKSIDAVGTLEMETADSMDVSYLQLIVNDPCETSGQQVCILQYKLQRK